MTSFTLLQGRDMEIEYIRRKSNIPLNPQRFNTQFQTYIPYEMSTMSSDFILKIIWKRFLKKEVRHHMVHVLFLVMRQMDIHERVHEGRSMLRTNKNKREKVSVNVKSALEALL